MYELSFSLKRDQKYYIFIVTVAVLSGQQIKKEKNVALKMVSYKTWTENY